MRQLSTYRILALALFFSLFYIAGIYFPTHLWGGHVLAFVPTYWAWALSVCFLAFAIVSLNDRWIERIQLHFNVVDFKHPSVPYLFAAMAVCLCLAFPIHTDLYGDAFFWAGNFDKEIIEFPATDWNYLLSIDLRLSSGSKVILAMQSLLVYLFGVTHREFLMVAQAIAVSLWSWIWVRFAQKHLHSSTEVFLFSITAIFSPLLLAFATHFEVYYLLYCLIMLWLITLDQALRKSKFIHFLLLGILTVALLRLHVSSILFAAIFVLSLLYQIKGLQRFFKPGVLFGLTGTAAVLALGTLYFFVTGDHTDLRELKGIDAGDRLFLPIFSPPAPYHRYNLFSWNHILDLINTAFFISGALIFLLITFFISAPLRKMLERIELKLSLLLSAGFLVLFFMLNPLLSMPVDWDLFALLFPILLYLLLQLMRFQQNEERSVFKMALFCSLFCLMGTLMLPISASKNTHSLRTETIGRRIFSTYYEWSAIYLDKSLSMISDQPELYEYRFHRLIDDLKPKAITGNDENYAHLLSIFGQWTIDRDLVKAHHLFSEAFEYASEHRYNRYRLFQSYFMLGEYHDALEHAHWLVSQKFPEEKKALRIAIHAALEADETEAALSYAHIYCDRITDKDRIAEIRGALLNGIGACELRSRFSSRKDF